MLKKISPLLIILMFPLLSFGNDIKTSFIDWKKGEIISRGESKSAYTEKGVPIVPGGEMSKSINQARLYHFNRAKKLAIHNITRSLKNIKLNAEKTVWDEMQQNDKFKSNIVEMLERTPISMDIPSDFLNNICRIKIKLGKILASLGTEFPENPFPESKEKGLKTKYTSLIIDTRQINISPMLLPVIYNDSGLEIYGKNYVSPNKAMKKNIVTYVTSSEEALAHKKAGEFPYTCEAMDSLKGSPVLANDDLIKFYSNEENLKRLRGCHVIFIINRKYK